MSLADMRARRDALDKQIRDAEAEQAASWNFALGNLSDGLWDYANRHSLGYADSRRKNVTTITLDRRVFVEFGYDDGEHTRFLAAYDDRGTRVEFDAIGVITERFLDFIKALLDRPASPGQEAAAETPGDPS